MSQKRNIEGTSISENAKAMRMASEVGGSSPMQKHRVSLPTWKVREEILKYVDEADVTIIVGETGSGKTTQIPQYIHERWPDKSICCTQPRRVAAMSVANRVSQEMSSEPGGTVGYTVRFDDQTSENTKIRYVTEGILLKEAMDDVYLPNYDVIILDEVHERGVNTDLLLGLMKIHATKQYKMLQGNEESHSSRHGDLKVVIMSATLDSDCFRSFFPNAAYLYIPGRLYPVDMHYVENPCSDYIESAADKAINIHCGNDEGDILIFLPGEEEIEDCSARIEHKFEMLQAHGDENGKYTSCDLVVLRAYSALPPHKIELIFSPPQKYQRKVIVSTNIAETSVTIEGICFVIDSGYCKSKQFHPQSRLESLLVTPISQASAKQRAGRAGRTRSGVCHRLYTESAFDELRPTSLPEMCRSNLCTLVLTMKKMRINNILKFPYIDAPSSSALIHALEMVHTLGALNDSGDITPIGRMMARFPLDPSMSRSLIAGIELGVANEVGAIIALLSSTSKVFVVPRDKASKRAIQDMQVKAFGHRFGDHIMLLRIFEQYTHELANEVQRNDAQRWAQQMNLNHRALYNANSIWRQLNSIVYRIDPAETETLSKSAKEAIEETLAAFPETEQQYQRILLALLRGHLCNVAHHRTKRDFVLVKNKAKFAVQLHPGCSLLVSRNGLLPDFLFYEEAVLTSNGKSSSAPHLRTCSMVLKEWLVMVAGEFFDPDTMSDDAHTQAVFRRLFKEFGKGGN